MIRVTPEQKDLLTLCALRAEQKSVDWNLLARACQSPEALQVLLGGDIPEESAVAHRAVPVLRKALAHVDDARQRVAAELEHAEAVARGW